MRSTNTRLNKKKRIVSALGYSVSFRFFFIIGQIETFDSLRPVTSALLSTHEIFTPKASDRRPGLTNCLYSLRVWPKSIGRIFFCINFGV